MEFSFHCTITQMLNFNAA